MCILLPGDVFDSFDMASLRESVVLSDLFSFADLITQASSLEARDSLSQFPHAAFYNPF